MEKPDIMGFSWFFSWKSNLRQFSPWYSEEVYSKTGATWKQYLIFILLDKKIKFVEVCPENNSWTIKVLNFFSPNIFTQSHKELSSRLDSKIDSR